MSDIPVGSPPAPPGRHAAPSGWYPDPVDARRERYWDGWQWSRDTRTTAGAQTPGPHAQQPYQPYQQSYQQPSQPNAPYGYPQGYPPSPAGVPGAQPPPVTDDGVPLAGWWWRFLAVVIDGLIVGVVATLLATPLWWPVVDVARVYVEETLRAAETGGVPPPQPQLLSLGRQLAVSAVSVAVQFVYVTVCWRFRQATPGKFACGLRVVPAGHGRYRGPLGWSMCLVRGLVWALPGLVNVLALVRLLDALFPLFTPRRQALHDLAAKTQVVKIN